MKNTYLIFILIFLTACGKNGGNSGESAHKQEEQRGYVDVSQGGEAPDLMNVTMDLPVEVSGDGIIFLKSGFLSDQGNRKACSLKINEQDIWHFSINGNTLRLVLSDGSVLPMKRLSSDRDVYGVWTWQGQLNNMKTFRRITLLSGRMIINQDCEG